MRLDAASRSFGALVVTTVLPGTYVLCGAFGSVLVPLAGGRIPRDGFARLLDGGDSSMALLGFLIVVAVSLVLGIRSMRRQLSATRRIAQSVRELMLPVPDTLARTTGEVGLDGRVVLLDVPERFSFAYGALTPRVAISRGLFDGVSHAELRAVLEHERYHVENLDPLKLLVAQTLSATVFFLPSLDWLRSRYLAGRELAADRRAVDACGRRPLASALLKVVGGPDWVEPDDVAAIGGAALMDVRVAQLETGVEPKSAPIATTRGVLSLAGAALFAAGLLASASSLGVALSAAALLNGLICAAAFGGAGMLLFAIVAYRAKRPMPSEHDRPLRGR